MSIELQIIIIAVIVLLLTMPAWFLLSKIEAWVEQQPKKSRQPNGKSPLVLGIGNGFGVSMLGDFRRDIGYVQYSFLMVIIPIVPLGCYISSMTSKVSPNWKREKTTYNIKGSQPWNVWEILCIYYQYWGRLLSIAAIIAIIAALFGLNK